MINWKLLNIFFPNKTVFRICRWCYLVTSYMPKNNEDSGLLSMQNNDKKEEGTWQWGILYNNELYNLSLSLNASRCMKSKWMREARCLFAVKGRTEKCIQNFIWKLQRKKPLWRCRCKYWDNIQMNLKGITC